MMKIEERAKLMKRIEENKEKYALEIIEISYQIVELQKTRNQLESKLNAVYEGNPEELYKIQDYRQQIQQIVEGIEAQENKISELNKYKVEIEKDSIQLLNVWVELSTQGKKDAASLQVKAEALQEQVNSIKNEASIHNSQAIKYATQVREWSKNLPQEIATEYKNFTV